MRRELGAAGSGTAASSACRWRHGGSGTARPPAGTMSSLRCSPGAGSWGRRPRQRLWGETERHDWGARGWSDTGGEQEAGAEAWLTFAVLQVADCHLQDVGLLQFGVGLVPRELLLQQQLQLLYAAVNAVPAHLLHHRLPQLRERRRQVGGGRRRAGGNGTARAGRVALTRFFSLGLSISTATVLGAMPGALEAFGEKSEAGAERAKPGVRGWRGPDPRAPALYRRGQRPGAWGPGAAAVPTLGGQWRRRPHKSAGPLAHAKLPVNWRGHNGRSPRSRWAARHNVRAVGTRSPSLASRGLMLRAPRLNMLPFPRPPGGGEGRKECSPPPLLSLLPSHSPAAPHRWLAKATGAEKSEFYN